MRGRNGLIVVAPSAHPGGGHYSWRRTGPVPLLLDSLADRLPDALDVSEAATDATVAAFLHQHTEDRRPDLLNLHVQSWRDKVAAGESRHHTTP